MAKEGIENGRQNEEQNLSRRRLRILEEVFKRGKVSISELRDMLRTEFGIRDSSRTLTRNIKKLQSKGFPIQIINTEVVISPISMEAFWKETDVGERLKNQKSAESKKRLAISLSSFLKEAKKKYPINSLMLCSGTTIYYSGWQLLACWEDLRFDTIYSNNVLVMLSFIQYRHHDIVLRMVGGDFDYETACLRSTEGIEELGRAPVNVVVTSFMGFCEKGFTTRQWHEVPEKLMNLLPSEHCKLVIIPIESSKVGRQDGHLVIDQKHGGASRGLADFLEDRGERRYVLITPRPSGRIAAEQYKMLDKWKHRGMEIVWAENT